MSEWYVSIDKAVYKNMLKAENFHKYGIPYIEDPPETVTIKIHENWIPDEWKTEIEHV